MEQIKNIEYKIKLLKKLNLTELKTILYINKNLSDNDKKNINDLIKNKIINSFYDIKIQDEDVSEKSNSSHSNQENILNTDLNKHKYDDNDININTDDIEISDNSYKSDNSNNSNNDYIDRKKILFDKNNKKYKNQTITHTSQKILNRMMSEAQYINNIGECKIDNISRPFSDEPMMNNVRELGKRKNVKK